MSEPFVAEIRIFGGNFAPRGWAFCNGQLLPISQNTALFSIIGTTYGGDGRTTTALPNLQGRVPMHPGRGVGLTARRLGQIGGYETETLTEAQIPSHSHSLSGSSEEAEREGSSSPTNQTPGVVEGGNEVYAGAANLQPMATDTVTPVGGGRARRSRGR